MVLQLRGIKVIRLEGEYQDFLEPCILSTLDVGTYCFLFLQHSSPFFLFHLPFTCSESRNFIVLKKKPPLIDACPGKAPPLPHSHGNVYYAQ